MKKYISELIILIVIFALLFLIFSLSIDAAVQYTCSSMNPPFCSRGTCPSGYSCVSSGKGCTCMQTQQTTTTIKKTTTTTVKTTSTTTTLPSYFCSSMKPPNCGQGTCEKGLRCVDYKGKCKCRSVTTTTTTTTTIPKCPSGCECLTAEDAKKKNYQYCGGKQIICGYDKYQNEMYCYEPVRTTTTIKITTTTTIKETGEKDKTPPKVNLKQVPEKIVANKTIKFIVEATDESGIGSIEILINGRKMMECKKSPCEFETEFPSVMEIDFGAIVSDELGNMLAAGSIFGITEGIDEECPETDSGIDPFNPGNIMTEPGRIDYENRTGILPTFVYDTCLNETFLREYYCNGTEIQSQIFNCRGTCYRGARLATESGGSMQIEGDACICAESDEGRDYYRQGYITGLMRDECINNETLKEYYCGGEGERGVLNESYRCPNGCNLATGECKCEELDPDGGVNFNEISRVTIGMWSGTDFCNLDRRNLTEYFPEVFRVFGETRTDTTTDCRLGSITHTCEGSCAGGRCWPPTCQDGVLNQFEENTTQIISYYPYNESDCGGPNCPPCPTCYDGVRNQDEEGVDCGGSHCMPCSACIPLIKNGNPDNKIDIVFIPNQNYSGRMNLFVNHTYQIINNSYFASAPIFSNRNKINFWYTEKIGTVNIDSEGKCRWSTPSGWNEDCPHAAIGAIVHIDSCRDYASGGVFSSEYYSYRTFVHESGHAIFGLADEYDDAPDCWTNYREPDPNPNIYETNSTCQSNSLNPRNCYKFTTCQGDWWKSDADGCIMQCGGAAVCPFGPDCERRVDWVFGQYS